MNRSARTLHPSHPLPRVTLERDTAAIAGTAQQLLGSFVTSNRPAEVWKEINGPQNQDKVVSVPNRTEDDSVRRLAALMLLTRCGPGSLESLLLQNGEEYSGYLGEQLHKKGRIQ